MITSDYFNIHSQAIEVKQAVLVNDAIQWRKEMQAYLDAYYRAPQREINALKRRSIASDDEIVRYCHVLPVVSQRGPKGNYPIELNFRFGWHDYGRESNGSHKRWRNLTQEQIRDARVRNYTIKANKRGRWEEERMKSFMLAEELRLFIEVMPRIYVEIKRYEALREQYQSLNSTLSELAVQYLKSNGHGELVSRAGRVSLADVMKAATEVAA
ncbi:hypothetical protein [Enterovibrio norvegicus]|uniref:hypothetical protein n=1 Tax=Enterovibrio norvegicus TaxID=188144 RepID=UPI00352CD672